MYHQRVSETTTTRPVRGGRGARARIEKAAADLFYANGIHATGVELVAERAGVSKRTLYKHFPSKNELVVHYLREIDASGGTQLEQRLADPHLPARERLLAIFDAPAGQIFRGCPFHNAAVESAGVLSDADELVRSHKLAFIRKLAVVADEAGLDEPERIAQHIATLFEGATALATSLDDGSPYLYARQAAAAVVGAASRRSDL